MRFFLSLFLFVISLNAVADYQAVKHYRIVFGAYTTQAPITDYNQVCQDFVVWYDQYLTTQTATYIGSTSTDCTFKRSGVTYNEVASISPMKDCSDGLGFRGWDTTPGGSNGNCLGDPPLEPESCEAGPDSNTGTQRVILGEGSQVCIDSCIYPLISPMSAFYDGAWRTAGDVGNNTGTSCTGSPAPATPTPEDECTKQGKSHGTVNGVVVCVDAGTPNSAPVKTSETSSTQTTTNITNEGDTTTVNSTSTSSTSVTVNGSGGVTSETTSTTENPDGSTTVQTEQKEQTKGEFCAENPTHSICQQKTDCDKYPNSVACQEMGDAPDPEVLQSIERQIGSIVKPTLPESSGCPAPLSISIGGHTITISYQPFCDYAEAFRPLVVAGAWLTAAFIIVGFRGGQD